MRPQDMKKQIEHLQRQYDKQSEMIGELVAENTTHKSIIRAQKGKVTELEAENKRIQSISVNLDKDNLRLAKKNNALSNEVLGWRLVFGVASVACALAVLTALVGG